jgi:hypothetical protein
MKKPQVAVAAAGASNDDSDPHHPSRAAPKDQSDHRPILAEPIEIAKFWRNRKHEAVVVSLREYGGRCLVDARVHFQDKDGRLQPMHKGISLVVSKLPELSAALAKAEKKARELGLLGPDGADD